ncbi:MAG: site-2 protease family protein [Nanoarchaeota archaeon]|nr:site-2 protease family protein [Nanoarchaeota archaeon]
MDAEIISVILFYSFLAFVIYKNRKKIEVMDKIFFVYKWKKGVDYIKKVARPDWFWKILSTLSIPVCLFFMIFSISLLVDGALSIIQSPDPSPTVSLLIPGVKLPGSDLYVPFWYGIISIIVLAVVHEGAHGIICLIEKIKLKTTGVGLLLFLPLAFVEPDEKSFLKSERLSRIRMLCAGSFANLTTALLTFLIVVNILNPFIDNMVNYTNLVITETVEGEPAGIAGIPNNSVILSINNDTVSNITDFYYKLLELEPNQNISIETSNGTFYLTTASNPDNESMAYLGVLTQQEWDYRPELKKYPEWILLIPFVIIQLLMWVSNLNFAVGIFNLFPLWITDGGKIVIDLISVVVRDKNLLLLVINALFLSALGLLLFNMFGPFLLNYLKLFIV